ncbi:hypothetical protein SAMN04488038_104244 [Solimonas aquatica]|uniref:Outer membrane protein beta-barrel domain-containing protein n=1 Tax=Solimonas aquatica TaxID=489703 RepID=A0A1H9E3J1_9GAMM|nr:DUF6588 family protein [Solimonas aquatica]SEQ19498.1 hypothetical protein SAMN04488038_104244 [Solimonas aquatica]
MRRLAASLLLLTLMPSAHAANADFSISCSAGLSACQQAFHDVVKDVGAVFNYKNLAPAEATGLTGIGVGAVGGYGATRNDAAWKTLTGSNVDAVGFVGGSISKGLPLGLDVAAFYTAVPGSGANFYGGQLRYAILEGGVASPALALAASYAKSGGIDDFDYRAWSVDALVSKGFAFITPYLGVGRVSAKADPSGALKTTLGLQNQSPDYTRVLLGLRFSLALLEITPEYEHIGDYNVYNLRVGLSF